MLKIIKTLTVVLFVLSLNAIAFSQSAGQRASNFVSKEGGFTIDLPADGAQKSSADLGETFARAATEYKWNTADGYYIVTFADLIEEFSNKKQFLTLLSRGLVEEMTKEGGKFRSERELTLDGNPGAEVVIELKGGMIGIGRFYMVKKRVYSLFSGWKSDETGDRQLKILGSFKLQTTN